MKWILRSSPIDLILDALQLKQLRMPLLCVFLLVFAPTTFVVAVQVLIFRYTIQRKKWLVSNLANYTCFLLYLNLLVGSDVLEWNAYGFTVYSMQMILDLRMLEL